MGSTIWRAEQRRETLRAMRRMLALMERDDALLAARATNHQPDGFPAGTSPGGGRSSDPTSSVERAVYMRLGIRDETSNANAEHFTSTASDAFGELWTAYRHLERADSLRAKALPPEARRNDDDIWCTNHLRFDLFQPRDDKKGGHCRRCYDWNRAQQALPDRIVLLYWEEHSKSTEQLVAEFRTRNGLAKAKGAA